MFWIMITLSSCFLIKMILIFTTILFHINIRYTYQVNIVFKYYIVESANVFGKLGHPVWWTSVLKYCNFTYTNPSSSCNSTGLKTKQVKTNSGPFTDRQTDRQESNLRANSFNKGFLFGAFLSLGEIYTSSGLI